MVVIFVSLVTNYAEHLFLGLLATVYISSLENVCASLLSVLSLGCSSFSSFLSFVPHSPSLLLLIPTSPMAAVTSCRGGGAQTCNWRVRVECPLCGPWSKQFPLFVPQLPLLYNGDMNLYLPHGLIFRNVYPSAQHG